MSFRVTGSESLFGLFGRHEVARESDSLRQKCERLALVLSTSNASQRCKRRRYRIVRAADIAYAIYAQTYLDDRNWALRRPLAVLLVLDVSQAVL
jgi:hypothetical protein